MSRVTHVCVCVWGGWYTVYVCVCTWKPERLRCCSLGTIYLAFELRFLIGPELAAGLASWPGIHLSIFSSQTLRFHAMPHPTFYPHKSSGAQTSGLKFDWEAHYPNPSLQPLVKSGCGSAWQTMKHMSSVAQLSDLRSCLQGAQDVAPW